MGGPCTAPAVPGAELDEEVPGTGLTVRQMMENYSAARKSSFVVPSLQVTLKPTIKKDSEVMNAANPIV